jgi:hypothetical protein
MRSVVDICGPAALRPFKNRTLPKVLMPIPLLPFWIKFGNGSQLPFENPALTRRWGSSCAICTLKPGSLTCT